MKIIEITVAPDGGTTVQTKGFAGSECREASRFVERALGRTTSDVPTPESFVSIRDERRLEQRG